MQADIRTTALYKEADALYRTMRRPGTGQISDAAELSVSPDGECAVFAGTIVDELKGVLPTRICSVNLSSGETRVITFGPNSDRQPKFSPDGRRIAFLSDRLRAGDFQLYLFEPSSGAARPTPSVEGWVEYLHWSPDGRRILLGVAGHGADVSGGQGAVTSERVAEETQSWMPKIDIGDESHRWRTVWIYEVETDRLCRVDHKDKNAWEAAWYGNEAIVAVVSPGPAESQWYHAQLHIIEILTGNSREVCKPNDQLGWPVSSPSGKHLAFVEGVASDRWIVAGSLQLIETSTWKRQRIDTRGIDVTQTEWRSDRRLLVAGHRGFETVVALYDLESESFTDIWVDWEITTGGRYATVSGFGDSGDCVLVGESFIRSPEIAVIRNGVYQTIKSFELGYTAEVTAIKAVERLTWKAPDGLEIQGWLLRPDGKGPHPLVMNVHGGPVWHWRPVWLGRGNMSVLMLLKRGYAVFLPNPRGSSGRGQEFARKVLGDLNGADGEDCLFGLDYLVNRGIADSARIGVTGISYGGNMTAWLIGQDQRFAAAVPVAPHTNHVTEHLISNIPRFVSLFLDDHYTNPGGKYFQRSPIMHASHVKTPTLSICGALDRCTPPEEAMQFHNALLENDVKSALVTYPEEGHGIRGLPAAIDYTARVVAWFQDHMPRSAQV